MVLGPRAALIAKETILKRLVVTVAAWCCLLLVQNASAVWEFVHKPLSGKYVIYGGDFNDARAPTPGDTKIAFNLVGNPAKEMFDAIGPDIPAACGAEDAGRMRQKDMLVCRYRPPGRYSCNIDFDLSTGLSIGRAGCSD